MSITPTKTELRPSGSEDFWKAPISKNGKTKPVHKRENASLLPVEIIVQQFGSNYIPPRKTKEKKL